MLDRSQRFGIAVSCALHVLVAGAFTLVSVLAPSRADSSLPPEAVIVEIRIDGPETRVIEAAPHRSGGSASPSSARATPLPAVSAPPPSVAAKPAASKPAPAPLPEPERAPESLAEPAPDLEAEPEPRPEPEAAAEPPRESDSSAPASSSSSASASAAPQLDDSPSEREAVAGASEDGSALAAADGTGGAGATSDGSNASGLPGRATGRGDEQDDPYARYIESVRTAVQARKHYPPLARKRAVEGRVVARVAIRADGRIQAIDFEQGAQPLLRRATHDAIRAAEPYPAPPSGAVTIELPIDYSLRDAS
ncbi:MAG: TonB family protein [Myxococcota bacterium]